MLVQTEQLLDQAELAIRTDQEFGVQIPIRTIEGWRYRKSGPPYIRIGKSILYEWNVVEKWLKDRFGKNATDRCIN